MIVWLPVVILLLAVSVLYFLFAHAPRDPDDGPRCDVCDYYDQLNMDSLWYETATPPRHDSPYERQRQGNAA